MKANDNAVTMHSINNVLISEVNHFYLTNYLYLCKLKRKIGQWHN